MYRVTCKQCGASAITDNGAMLQNAVSCQCCTQNHDHQAAADSCPGTQAPSLKRQHPGADCTHGSGNGTGCVVLTPEGESCPGGHCYPGVEGCTVCRPLSVDWLGNVQLAPAAAQAGLS